MHTYPPVPAEYAAWARFFDWAYLLCAVTAATAATSKAAAWRRDRQPALLALVLVRVAGCVAFLCGMPTVQQVTARALDVPNVATLVLYPSIVLQSLASLLILRFWQQPPERAWRTARGLVAVYAVIVPAMVVLFLASPTDSNRAVDFDVYYARVPTVAAFQLVYDVCFAAGLLASIRMTRRYAVLVADAMPWARRGLTLTMVGCTLALGHLLTKVPALVALWCGWDGLNFASVVVGPLCSIAAALIIHCGATVPAWGSRAETWLRHIRMYRWILPLWRDAQTARPDIALQDPPRTPWAGLAGLFDLRHRLYRAVIEIRDAQRELRPWFDPEVAERAGRLAARAGLAPAERDAVVEAALLKGAFRLLAEGGPRPADAHVVQTPAGGEVLADELALLAAVAAAYTGSPLVAEAVPAPHDDDVAAAR